MNITLIYVAIVSVVAFGMYGYDKQCAIRSKWRVSEFKLLAVAFVGGAFGALLGMSLFRHKTKHLKFRLCVPLFLLIQVVLFYLIFFTLGK